jgi:hypothetical protein
MNVLIAETIRANGRGAKAQLARDAEVKPSTVTRWTRDIVPERHRWPTIERSLGMKRGTLQAAFEAELTQPAGVDRRTDELLERLRTMDDAMRHLAARVTRLEKRGR